MSTLARTVSLVGFMFPGMSQQPGWILHGALTVERCGELLGDGERVEHQGQPTTRPAEAKPAPPPGRFRPDFGAFTGMENE